MEDVKLVKKITDWNAIGLRAKGRLKNRWREEVINDIKKLNCEMLANTSKVEKPGMIWSRGPKLRGVVA